MVPANSFVYISGCLLLIKLTLTPSISCSKLMLSASEVNMTCQIEYKRYRIVDIKFWFHFDSIISSNISTWDFWLEQCDPTFHNKLCDIWETKDSSKKMCQMVMASFQIYCIKEIDLFAEIRSTKPYHYRFYAKKNSKETLSKKLGKIRYLQCECKYFDFGQNIQVSIYPDARKADVQIGPFYDIPKLTDTKLKIVPNKDLSIKKYNDKHFEISSFDICPSYRIAAKIKTWPTCANWEIKSSSLEFPFETLTVDDISCKFNQTHTILNQSTSKDSKFYYEISFNNEIFTKNITKRIVLLSKWVKNELEKNLSAFVKMCVCGCNQCGTRKLIICFSKVRTENGKEEVVPKTMSPYLWFLVGILFVAIIAVLK